MKARKSIIISILLGLLIFFSVHAQGSAPTISEIPNQTTDEDTATGAIGFTVSDSDTPIEDLIVSGESSDQALLPDANIVIGGAGADLTVTLTPSADQNGTATITLSVSDGEQDASETFDLIVNPVNDGPPVCSAVSLNTSEDANGVTNPSCTDVDGDTLSYSIVGSAGHGAASTSTTQLLYDPSDNYFGEDAFTYAANDGTADSDPADVSVTVAAVNDAPVCSPVSIITDEETKGSAAPSCTDIDGDNLNYSIVSGPAHGSAAIVSSLLEYTPALDYFGNDQFTYLANDGELNSNTANANVTINNVNDAPVAQGQSVTTDEDTDKNITLVAIDVDGDSLNYQVVKQPDHGNLSGTLPNLTYDPDNNYFGSDSFTFKVNDNTTDSNVATVSITVNPINDAPTDLSLTPNSVNENQPNGTIVGFLSTTDPDDLAHTYDLVDGSGDDNNSSFDISGNTLITADSFDFETKSSYTVRIQTNDGKTNGKRAESFTINIINTPKAIIKVSPTTGLITSESGTQVTFSVELVTKPSANVNIGLSSSDTSEGIVSPPTSLTFTPLNWKTAKTVTVKGVDDLQADGQQPYTIITSAASSGDPDYNGVDPANVSVQNADNDSAGLTIAPSFPSSVVTTEGMDGQKINVKLNTQPTANVTVNFSSTDTSEGNVLPTSLVFTPADWNTIKEVNATGVDDLQVDGDKSYKINITTTSADIKYNNLKSSVSAVNRDAPTIEWVLPVRNFEVYYLEELIPFTLKVNKVSNEPIDKVRFYRWDATQNKFIPIGEDVSSPYQMIFDPNLPGNDLKVEHNQFFADAIYKNVLSVRVYFWVFNGYRLMIPVAVRAP